MKTIAGAILALMAVTSLAQTTRIDFTAPKVYPEGIAFYQKGNTFFVSSVTTGTIGIVDPQGNYKVFYKDSTLKSTFGLKVDAKRDILWACASDPNYSKYSDSSTFKKMARVISLDLKTGKKISDINLSDLKPGKHFANDLALDEKGNLYVTDSYAPIIYRIDLKGIPNVFLESDEFKGKDVGLNGIVYHPKGYLIVAHNSKGILYKVDLKNNNTISKVKLATFFSGVDGLLLNEQNNLILVQNKGVNKAFELVSNDNWLSAKITLSTDTYDRFQNPTTATLMNGKIYLINSKMNELADSTMGFSKEFSVQLVKLKPVK